MTKTAGEIDYANTAIRVSMMLHHSIHTDRLIKYFFRY